MNGWKARLTTFALAIAAFLSAMPARASGEAGSRSKWSAFLDLGGTVQEGSIAILLHRGDHIGNPLIGVAETTAYRAGIGYQAWPWVSFNTAYSRAEIRFGSDFLPFENIDIGKARLEEAQLTITLNPHGDPFAAHGRWTVFYRVGIVTGVGHISNERLLPEGQDSLGVERLRAVSGALIGLDVEFLVRIARTGWAVGLSATALSGGPELRLETDPNGQYESGAGRLAPETYGIRVRYRFR